MSPTGGPSVRVRFLVRTAAACVVSAGVPPLDTASASETPIVLRAAGVCVVLAAADGVPVVLHWGADPGAVDALDATLHRPRPGGGLDVEPPVSLVPLHVGGFPGRPGLLGHRHGGRDWAPRFVLADLAVTGDGEDTGGSVVVTAVDRDARLRLVSRVRLTATGALRADATVHNDGDRRYLLDSLSVTLPVPGHAAELVTYTGRWTREMHAERLAWTHGAVSVENRAGRTSHEHPALIWACTPGAGEWSGEVWGVHVAWSGNHSLLADCLPDGRRIVQGGELLHPGEICLEPGESYTSAEVVATWSDSGFTPASWRFHREVRSRPGHPGPERPRPVLVNTWEAVYFDHDPVTLRALADAAAAVGVERFVLDDGWFGSRRDDGRGLGDWTVSADAHPEGLDPLISYVRGLGMDFGIWVEPEMVNPDSDLYRAHPDWVLGSPDPVLGRKQLVLDIGRPEAFEHVLAHLDALLSDHDIAFVKWDMNRPHAGGSGASGAAGTHAQTLAVYRLFAELQRRHPGVEFESCASGGGRIDHRILETCVRVWTSDCNDAIERQVIQQGTSMLVPPEVMGAHIGPTRSHTTGRVESLGFRAATALFGHLGLEWNLLELDERERTDVAALVALHKRFRPLLHGGDTVRFDVAANGPRPSALAHGVYATDRSEALVSYAQVATGMSLVPPPLLLPGLDPDRRYVVDWVQLPGGAPGPAYDLPIWMSRSRDGDPVALTGRQLAVLGLQLPVLWPARAVLIHLH